MTLQGPQGGQGAHLGGLRAGGALGHKDLREAGDRQPGGGCVPGRQPQQGVQEARQPEALNVRQLALPAAYAGGRQCSSCSLQTCLAVAARLCGTGVWCMGSSCACRST
jgi:hypothetical protein